MAAGPWTFYQTAKKHLCDGSIDLDTDTFQMSLYTSASNAASSLATVSAAGSLTGEVANGFGYATGGKAIPAVTWAQGASVGEVRFDSTQVVWSAAGGDINNIKYAVVWKAGPSAAARKVVMYSQLSTAQFNVTSGNTLTITPSANGYFELN